MALWFVALSTNAGGLDVCPMDGVAQTVVGTPMQMPMGGRMAGMGAASRARVGPTPAPPVTPAPDGPAAPMCMGVCCCCNAMAVVPPCLEQVPAPAVLAIREPVPLAPAAAAPAAPRYLLPPAIGPPALHTT